MLMGGYFCAATSFVGSLARQLSQVPVGDVSG